MSVEILEAARAATAAGLAVLPVVEDGTKRPDVSSWRVFMTRRPTAEEIEAFDFGARAGLGVVAGGVTGYECWDFDCAATFDRFLELAHETELGAVVERIRRGYEDATPRGGRRWIVRLPAGAAFTDTTLAQRPGRVDAGEKPVEVLIEVPTFNVIAPSHGPTHPTGRPYVHLAGDFSSIATYSVDEREALVELARSFDRMPRREVTPPVSRPTPTSSARLRPGDDYNRRATWPEILPEWTPVYTRGDVTYWRRPGKDRGVSATVGYGGDLLYVFTSSTHFAADRSYSKFAAYAYLHHAGDFAAATRALGQLGYGRDADAAVDPATPDARAPGSRAGADSALERAVEAERIKRQARRIVDLEERPPAPIPSVLTLAERLRRPVEPVAYRIDGFLPRNGRAILAAQYKAGKTTLTGNLVRSLVDGDAFLGREHVEPIVGTVTLIDLEMSERQLNAWLRAQRIHAADRAIVVPLRGSARAFDLLNPEVRLAWARTLRSVETEVLVVDCLRPILNALGLDESHEAGRFLVELDHLLTEAGIAEAVVVHHMGHLGERSRGDSRLRDWPDVEWRLVRKDEDPSSARFLSAYGRDVDQPEQQLAFDPLTRRLVLAGGSRENAKVEAALAAVLEALRGANGPRHGQAVQALLRDKGHSRNSIEEALKLGVSTAKLTDERGENNSHNYLIRGPGNRVQVPDPDSPFSEGGFPEADRADSREEPGGFPVSRGFPIDDGKGVSRFPTPYRGRETGKPDDQNPISSERPAWVDEPAEPDDSDPIGSHDEEPEA